MANYHLEVQVISRGKGRSVTKLANYISGERLYDSYLGRTYYSRRNDVLDCRIFMPAQAPQEFYKLQSLCTAIETAEVRRDARTAREFKGSLPNELPLPELRKIVASFINQNFISRQFCAIAAIHAGTNTENASWNNPHVHIIIPTRKVEATGFCKRKDREQDRSVNLLQWRKGWAVAQNQAYARNHLDCRVSHETLLMQGIDRIPTIHLSRIDWQKEQRGERTLAGDKKRDIVVQNQMQVPVLYPDRY